MESQHYFAPEMATIRYGCTSRLFLYPAWMTKICRYRVYKLNEKNSNNANYAAIFIAKHLILVACGLYTRKTAVDREAL